MTNIITWATLTTRVTLTTWITWTTWTTWIVSYPTRWSFSFILGPLHWSSISNIQRTQKLQLCTTTYIGQDLQREQSKFFSGARLGSMSCLRGGSPSETVHQAWRDARVHSAQVTDRPLFFFEIFCTNNICNCQWENFLCHQSYL